jgi:outer membrane protein W
MKHFALLALLSLPLFAQQAKEDFQIFAYAGNIAITSSDRYGTTVDSSYGLALSKFVTPRVSLELSASSQDWWEYEPGPYHFGVPIVRIRHTVYPISFDSQYHFANDSRWKPYLGLGVRYVNATAHYYNLGARYSPEINGGVSFMITPHVALRFDGKQELRTRGPAYDPPTRGSVGVAWHF